VHTGTPFYFPHREALVDLYTEVVNTPGVNHHLLSHGTMAPAVVDPKLIEQLSAVLLEKSPVKLPRVSTHPEARILSPLIGLETGSVRMAKQIMPGKSAPFPIEEWPSVVIQGLTILNRNNWFPVLTLMIGNPGETDADSKATLDLIHEVERRRLFAFFVPSIFTPLHDTRLATQKGVIESREMTPLQWQILLKCWKMSINAALHSWWGPPAWRTGAFPQSSPYLRTRGRNGALSAQSDVTDGSLSDTRASLCHGARPRCHSTRSAVVLLRHRSVGDRSGVRAAAGGRRCGPPGVRLGLSPGPR